MHYIDDADKIKEKKAKGNAFVQPATIGDILKETENMSIDSNEDDDDVEDLGKKVKNKGKAKAKKK